MMNFVNMISKRKQFTYYKEKLCARLKCELCEIKFRDESDLKTPTRKQFGAMNVRKNEIVNTTISGLGALNAIQYGIVIEV